MTTNISRFLLPGALLAVIIIMVMPLPSWVLDIGLSLSFALAILIFAVTLFIERPLDFSIFLENKIRIEKLFFVRELKKRLFDETFFEIIF